MSAERSLRLVDTATGDFTEYDGDDAQEIMRLRDRVRELEQAVELAEKDLRVKRAKITELQNLKAVERMKSDARPFVENVFDYWRRVTGHDRCTLTGDRFDALWGIIKASGIDPSDAEKMAPLVRRMRLAVDGCHFDPWITMRKNGTRHVHDDITHVFRSTDAMDEYARKSPAAAEALRRREARRAAAARDARLRLPDPRSIGGSWALEARMLTAMNGHGPHLQAR